MLAEVVTRKEFYIKGEKSDKEKKEEQLYITHQGKILLQTSRKDDGKLHAHEHLS